jgi:microcystin degradation protein MlrC
MNDVNNIEKMICTAGTEEKQTVKASVPAGTKAKQTLKLSVSAGTEASPLRRKRSIEKISYGFYQFYLHI